MTNTEMLRKFEEIMEVVKWCDEACEECHSEYAREAERKSAYEQIEKILKGE